MGSEGHPHFNLVDEPWIVAKAVDGRIEIFSLKEIFEKAPDLESLANETPQQDFAILRVLLAVLQRAISPDLDEDDEPAEVWSRLWNSPELPCDSIQAYLDEWHGRFDLFDEDLPFMQVAGLKVKKLGDPRKLMCISENKVPLIPGRTGARERKLNFPEAARWLITAQAFDTSGNKTGVDGDPGVKSGKGRPGGTGWAGRLGGVYVQGDSLKETLVLNSVLCTDNPDELFPEEDIPAWEQAGQPVFMRNREPLGRADLYTWQARRILLFPDKSEVFGVALTVGDKIDKANRQYIEPMSAWMRNTSEEKRLGESPIYTPLRHNPQRALWRGLDAMLPVQADSPEADRYVIPGIVSWLNYLASANGGRRVPLGKAFRLRAIGYQYGTQDSLITQAIDDSLGMHMFLISPQGSLAVTIVRKCIAATDETVKYLGNLAADLVSAAGFRAASGKGRAQDALSQARQSAQSNAYFDIDRAFHRWLLSIDSKANLAEREADWASKVRGIVGRIARDLVSQAEPAAFVGHPCKRGNKEVWVSVASAENRFRYGVNKALKPLEANQSDTGKAAVQ